MALPININDLVTGKTVEWDRINHDATVEDLDIGVIREFLQTIKSDLFAQSTSMPFEDLCRQMRIVSGSNEYVKPINAALLFFSKQPHEFFRGAITEIIQFKDDSGTQFSENIFRGPIHHQANAVLNFIRNNIISEKVIKVAYKAEANRFFNFPYQAVEEAIINAYYHRSYEHQSSVEINIHPDKIEILSFPGPLPPINNESFKQKRVVTRDYRNRRIGDFLKELDLTEGRGTGIPKIFRAHKSFIPNKGGLPLFTSSGLEILIFCAIQPHSKSEIAIELHLSPQSGTLKRLLPKLVADGVLEYTIPDKPNSSSQKYRTTALGLAYLDK